MNASRSRFIVTLDDDQVARPQEEVAVTDQQREVSSTTHQEAPAARETEPAAPPLTAICHRIAVRLGADCCGVALLENGVVHYVAGHGFDWECVPRIPLGESLLGGIVKFGVAIASRDIREDTRCASRAEARELGVAALLGCPIEDSHSVMGALVALMYHPFDWAAEQLATLEGAATAIGLQFDAHTHDPASWPVKQTGRAPGNLVLASSPIRHALRMAETMAPNDLPVLLLGERGTGKSEFARIVHDRSERRGEFVTVSCGEIAPDLLEAELFGHAKGAFTGAVAARAGVVAAAEGGTLFLDEIGDLPSNLQPKLLRFLERREIRPIGEDKSRTADVRILAATNRDICPGSGFRPDLYDRLSFQIITLPPLRERPADLTALIDILPAVLGERLRHPVSGLGPKARAALLKYSWPGNIRELQNVLAQAMLRVPVGRTVSISDLPSHVSGDSGPTGGSGNSARKGAKPSAKLADDDMRRAYAQNEGNVSRVARELGVSRQAVYNRLKRMQMR